MARGYGLIKEMSGVLGDVVIAHRGNVTFIKKRPQRSKNPLTQMAMEKREKFGIGGKIAGAISSIIEIKQLWASNPEKNQTSYNRMFKANHGQFNIEDLTGKIVISDGGGLEVFNASIEIEKSGVHITCERYESRDINKRAAARKILAAGLIVLIKPTDFVICPKFQLMKFKTEISDIKNGAKFAANFKYIGGDLEKFQAYEVKKAFGVLITFDGESNPIDISETIESKI
jgi:hypothetical protein